MKKTIIVLLLLIFVLISIPNISTAQDVSCYDFSDKVLYYNVDKWHGNALKWLGGNDWQELNNSFANDISALHRLLKAEGYYVEDNDVNTKNFGISTAKAVAAFQKANNLDVSGIFGKKEVNILNTKYSCKSGSSVDRYLKVLTPNNGVIEFGNKVGFTWESKGVTGDVKVSLIKQNTSSVEVCEIGNVNVKDRRLDVRLTDGYQCKNNYKLRAGDYKTQLILLQKGSIYTDLSDEKIEIKAAAVIPPLVPVSDYKIDILENELTKDAVITKGKRINVKAVFGKSFKNSDVVTVRMRPETSIDTFSLRTDLLDVADLKDGIVAKIPLTLESGAKYVLIVSSGLYSDQYTVTIR